MIKDAMLSADGQYRYSLTRQEEDIPESISDIATVLFILGNPSTADAENDDPTVRRCIGYMRSWDYGKMVICNVNPYRATKPIDCIEPPENILEENDTILANEAIFAHLIICAWGAWASISSTIRVLNILGSTPLHVLELSKDGTPKHPLYLKGDLKPIPWKNIDNA